jgi:hypothetical protein
VAVKVIGTSPQHVYHSVCTRCASMLEFTERDTTSKYIKDYGGGGDTYHFVDCPVCMAPTNVTMRRVAHNYANY